LLQPVAWVLDQVAQQLIADAQEGEPNVDQGRVLPSASVLADVCQALSWVLFPLHFFGPASQGSRVRAVEETLRRALTALRQEIYYALMVGGAKGTPSADNCERHSSDLVMLLANRLPRIRALLIKDLAAAYAGDPALIDTNEALLCYPGLEAILHHRIAHALHTLAVPLVPRMITELAHSKTGIDIHPGAEIGESFFIDHGTGVVIGETCRIGARVRIYQGVTLGARSIPVNERGHAVKGTFRHPIVGNDVIIYAGATILGRVVIGHGSTIAGNVWLTRSVPPGSRVTQADAINEGFGDGSGI
jgi:serine O-acetyltransferase